MNYYNIITQSIRAIKTNPVRIYEYILKYGPYLGRSLHWVMLKDPAYVERYCEGADQSSFMYREFCRLKRIMDSKPLVVTCRCGSQATKFSFHNSHPAPQFWCNACNPAGSGIVVGSLSIGSTYNDLCNSFKGKPSMIR